MNLHRFANKFLLFSCTALLISFSGRPPLSAAELDAEQWEITADKIVRYENPPSVIAEGHVVLEKKETRATAQTKNASRWANLLGADADESETPEETSTTVATTIKADWVAYDINMGLARARGNILINVHGDELTAERGVINLKDATGSFENAAVARQEMELHLEGKVLEKTGDLTYHIEDGWIITCKLQDGQPPPWSLGASDTKITDGGYAFLKNAVFRVRGIPVFYSPYMILPAKHERQTGFLFPSWSFSDRDGFGFELPLFLNVSPIADITLYPRYMTERGLLMGAEFRYASDENSKGMFMAHYLDDDLSDPETELSYYRDGHYTHTNAERYWLRGKADQNFGPWVSRLDIDLVSDKDYLREFSMGATSFNDNNLRFNDAFGRGFEQKLDQYRENSLKLMRSWDDGSILQTELMAINDVSKREYDANNPSQFWKLPSVSFSGLKPLGASPADISWDSSYNHFWREQGVRAQRFDLFPEISTNVPLSRYLESSVKGGIRETFYLIDGNGADDWKNEDSANRWLYTLGGEIATTLYREYGAAGSGFSHTIRPFVEYEYLDIPDTDALPKFDTIDSLEEANTIYYGINNFFALFSEDAGRLDERDLFFLKVRQGYDMRSEKSDAPFTPVEVKTGFYPVPGSRLTYTGEFDVYGEGVEHSVEADYRSKRGDNIGIDYRYNETQDISSVSGGIWLILPYNFAAGYSIERSLEQRITIEEKFRLLYQPACWSVELASDYTPDDQTIMLIFRLANIASPFGVDLGGAGI